MGKETLYRFADSTVIEPLVNRWSAWAHVIAPVPASLHLLNYQLPALSSYLDDPKFHFDASRDPQLIGGPFADIPPERAAEVKALLESTRATQRRNVEFARDLTQFQNSLAGEAQGLSLEPYYRCLPESLSGYVELVYDYYNHPTVRFIEPLLYESDYYDRALQSFRLGRLTRDEERAFFMSTPRLRCGGDIDWELPFADERVDRLFGLDRAPRPLEEIRELLGLSAAEERRLLPLLSCEPLGERRPWDGDEIRIRYFGHACALVEWKGVSILTDPYVGVRPTEGGMARLSYDDLPEKIDFALVTHNHQDHFAFETLLRLRQRIGTLVVPKSYGLLYGDVSLKLMARKLGFKNVVELDTFESVPLPDGEIVAIPFLGEHGDFAYGKSAFAVRAGSQRLLFAADSDCLDQNIYRNVRSALGPIETVFLGMECVGAPLSWSAGPILPRRPQHEHDNSRRYHGADSASAIKLLETVGARRVYNYAMGIEPWIEFLLGLCLTQDSTQIRESNKLLAMARGRGFEAAERLEGTRTLYLPQPSSRHRVCLSTPDGAQTGYWEQQLSNLPAPLDLPYDGARRGHSAGRRALEPLALSAALSDSLREFSREHDCSLFVTLAALLKALLYRYTEEEDLLVGAVWRESADASAAPAGLRILRTDFSGEPDFLTASRRVREVIARAAENGDVPHEEAAVRVLFDLTNSTAHPDEPARCELLLSLSAEAEGISGHFAYDPDLFEPETIRAMAEHLQLLAERATCEPHRPLQEFPLAAPFSQTTSVGAGLLEDVEARFAF